MNFNVTFEIGYAIGLGKRVYLFRNSNFRRDSDLIDRIGIFDTLGFASYSDQNQLCECIYEIDAHNYIRLKNVINRKTPVYLLQTPQNNQSMISILGRIKKARLGFKSFIPQEEIRMSAVKAVDDISSSLGVVVPILSTQFADAPVHNIRAAFVAGLSLALNKPTLILQPSDGPAPLDVRDIVRTYGSSDDISALIADFALEVTERFQADGPIEVPKGNFLADLTIGDPIAENEFQTLSGYYLRTDQFGRASRGEVNLIVGRKGAGKTALFSQLRNQKRSNQNNIVVDLKPEGYQLIKLKEDVLDFLAEGARTHLIVAFFEYVFYLEICYKLLEKDRDRHTRDARLYEPYLQLQAEYETSDAGEGDFSERLNSLAMSLAKEFRENYGTQSAQRLNATQVTELIYKHDIRNLKKALSNYLQYKDSVWLLFDNLDKGWSPHGVTDSDILILRCLIDAARKIQRQMHSDNYEFFSVVFVRNDVYQLLVYASADHSKESPAVLDWTDADLLRELLRRRIVKNIPNQDASFDDIWNSICISHHNGEETSQYLIERSLMRPRNFLKLFSYCRGFAVNLGKEKIQESDIEKGLHAYSLDLLAEADQELTDIVGEQTNLMHHFIAEGDEYEKSKLISIIQKAGINKKSSNEIFEFLLYYGFFGIKIENKNTKYIYDVGYDMNILKVLLQKYEENSIIVLNPAFYAGLNL